MNVARFGLRYEKLIVFILAVLTVLGIYAYTVTPASIFPAMSFARVDVVASAGDLPPDQVRVAVTLPLEQAFQALPSVTRVLATSTQGSGELVVEFDPKTDVQLDLQHVNDAINQTRANLPAQTSVVANVVNPNSEPVVSYAFVSHTLSQTLLRELVAQSLVPQFYGTGGLGRILVLGGPEREYHVTLDPAALSAHGIAAQDVSKAIADANTVSALGIRQQYYQANVLLLDAKIKDAAALRAVTVPDAQKNPIPLSELGSVSVGVAPLASQVSFDAEHAVIFNAYALAGADAVKMAESINEKFSSIQRTLPAGVTALKYWDQSELVVESQRSLRDAILLGALLAVLVIFAFLRNLRLTLIAAIVIPLAMAVTLFVMQHANQSLNLMSVGGLAVAVGLIIDDAIVVIENVARNLHERLDLSKRETIVLSMQQLAGPMAASTLTTVVVFVPLALLSGVSGFFFRALAFTLSASLLVSLTLALFVTPILANRLIAGGHEEESRGFIDRTLAHYDDLLQWALAHRRAVYWASAGILVLTVLLMMLLPSDFLPKLDEGQFEISYRMPVGTTLAASDAAATVMERIVKADPAVARTGRLTGIDSNGFSPIPQSGGLLRVKLKPHGKRDGYEVVSERLRARISEAIPAAQLDFHQILEDIINDLSGAPAPLELDLRGPDQATLIAIAQNVADRISKVRGVADVFDGVVYDDPTIRIAPVGPQLAAAGLSGPDVNNALLALTQGTVATSLASTNSLVPVRVRVAGGSADPTGALLNTGGGAVALRDIAHVRRERLSNDINEENGQRVVRITANIAGSSLSAVVGGIQAGVLSKMKLPPGYKIQIGGQYRAQQQSFKEFLSVIFIAVALVFAVMLATFHSYRLPLVILTAIPLALIGVALGLFLTRTPFNVSSFMGLLLLVGIVVKNGILLIDVANQRRLAGDDVHTALRVAGRTRLRPIVMTTFAAIGGLLPLALGLGAGAEMERPLAIAVIGGLSTATAFTLLVIPVLYAGFAGNVQVGAQH